MALYHSSNKQQQNGLSDKVFIDHRYAGRRKFICGDRPLACLYSPFSDAISIENLYFTSDLTSRP